MTGQQHFIKKKPKAEHRKERKMKEMTVKEMYTLEETIAKICLKE